MTSKAQNKCAEIMRVLKDTGRVAGDWISIDLLYSRIEMTVGVDKRTKEQYSKALCSFGYLRAGENFNFQILKFPGDADNIKEAI